MTDKQIEQIGDFLNGEMGAEEKKSFEQELETDPALLAALDTYHAVETNMQHADKYTSESDLKNTLDNLNAEFFKASEQATNNTITNDAQSSVANKTILFPTIFKNKLVWKLLAAVFFGAIAMGTWHLLKGKNEKVAIIANNHTDTINKNKLNTDTLSQTPALVNLALQDTLNKTNQREPKKKALQVLFAQYFKPDTAPEEKGDALEDAFSAYNKKQYKNAAAAFENADLDLARGDETDVHLTQFYASYYRALSLMAIDMNDKAINQLQSLSTTPNSLLKVKVEWYLALAYLKTGKPKRSLLLLDAISKDRGAGEYIPKAKILLIEIRKIN